MHLLDFILLAYFMLFIINNYSSYPAINAKYIAQKTLVI